jgi:hypothetical protein
MHVHENERGLRNLKIPKFLLFESTVCCGSIFCSRQLSAKFLLNGVHFELLSMKYSILIYCRTGPRSAAATLLFLNCVLKMSYMRNLNLCCHHREIDVAIGTLVCSGRE